MPVRKEFVFPVSRTELKSKHVELIPLQAEIVAVDDAIKKIGVPSLMLRDTILGKGERKLTAILKEDNEACILVLESLRNSTMRHLERVHELDLAWLCERFEKGDYKLDCCPTREMSADIFTKHFTDRLKWLRARMLIGHFSNRTENLGDGSQRLFVSCDGSP